MKNTMGMTMRILKLEHKELLKVRGGYQTGTELEGINTDFDSMKVSASEEFQMKIEASRINNLEKKQDIVRESAIDLPRPKEFAGKVGRVLSNLQRQ